MQKQSFLRGTFILSIASFINRMLGFGCMIFLARLLGAEGMGMLMMAQPLVPLIITLTELGLPVAISKLVSEAETQGNEGKMKRILVISLLVTGTSSVLITVLTLLYSKPIASFLLADQRAYYTMLAIIPIAPIVAVSAVLKGYFRGRQHMLSIALSDIIEHLAQMSCVFLFVYSLLPYGVEYAAAGAMASSVASEAVGLIFLFAKYKMNQGEASVKLTWKDHLKQGRQTLYELLYIGLPTTGHGFIHSIYEALQPMLVMKSLAIAGVGTALATQQFGMLFGYAFPLLFLPGFITHSLSTALIPAISEAKATNNVLLINKRMDQAMRVALLVGAPSTVILYIWAEPLATLVYQAPEAGILLKIMAPIFFLHYFDAPLHAILLGLGRASTALWNYLIATVMKGMAIFVFGAQFGIIGVSMAFNFGICFLMILNLLSISSLIGFYLEIRQYIKTGCCMLIMAASGHALFSFLQASQHHLLWNTLISVFVSLFVFYLGLTLTNITKQHPLLKVRIHL